MVKVPDWLKVPKKLKGGGEGEGSCASAQHGRAAVRTALAAALSMCVVALWYGVSHAWTLPQQGTFAYTAYDIFVNKLLQGPPGAVGALALMTGAVISAVRSNFTGAGIMAISSILLYKAPDLIQNLGFNI